MPWTDSDSPRNFTSATPFNPQNGCDAKILEQRIDRHLASSHSRVRSSTQFRSSTAIGLGSAVYLASDANPALRNAPTSMTRETDEKFPNVAAKACELKCKKVATVYGLSSKPGRCVSSSWRLFKSLVSAKTTDKNYSTAFTWFNENFPNVVTGSFELKCKKMRLQCTCSNEYDGVATSAQLVRVARPFAERQIGQLLTPMWKVAQEMASQQFVNMQVASPAPVGHRTYARINLVDKTSAVWIPLLKLFGDEGITEIRVLGRAELPGVTHEELSQLAVRRTKKRAETNLHVVLVSPRSCVPVCFPW